MEEFGIRVQNWQTLLVVAGCQCKGAYLQLPPVRVQPHTHGMHAGCSATRIMFSDLQCAPNNNNK
eukprot:1161644-Pelagomonas_calceolata.AAC.7